MRQAFEQWELDFEIIQRKLANELWPAAYAALPFALSQVWQLPCAYERSVKILRSSLRANRYLLAFEAGDVSCAHVEFACAKLGMPVALVGSIHKRMSRVNKFMVGFEDEGDSIVFKVYLELRRYRSGNPCCHIGWKHSIPAPGSGGSESDRITFYKPLRRVEVADLVADLSQENARAVLLRAVVLAAHVKHPELICLLVSEVAGRRSYDWNVYPGQMRIEDFASSIRALAEHEGIQVSQIDRWLQLSGHATLGHIASGTDAHGNGFLTLYYSAE